MAGPTTSGAPEGGPKKGKSKAKKVKKNIQSGTGTKANIGCPAAGKTGTTDNFNDAWYDGYTPHLAVKVDSRTQVPAEYVKGGEITLNISPNAVHKLLSPAEMGELFKVLVVGKGVALPPVLMASDRAYRL